MQIYQVDAFTSAAFAGNPAAVCLLTAAQLPMDDSLRLSISAEMALAETAFLEPLDASAEEPYRSTNRFRLRWFTPTTEVPLCGHATLASAAVVYQAKQCQHEELHFETVSAGTLSVRRIRQGSSNLIQMSLPLYDPVEPPPASAAPGSALVAACFGGLPLKEARYTSKDDLCYVLLVLGDGVGRAQLEALAPDMAAMHAAASAEQVHGVIVSISDAAAAAAGAAAASGGSGSSSSSAHPAVLSRFFGPWMGIPEDHVTGSAHAVLGPHYCRALGVTQFWARQCSARGGDVHVRVDWDAQRVFVSGDAVLVLSGTLSC